MGVLGARTWNLFMLGSEFLKKEKEMKEMWERGEASTSRLNEWFKISICLIYFFYAHSFFSTTKWNSPISSNNLIPHTLGQTLMKVTYNATVT